MPLQLPEHSPMTVPVHEPRQVPVQAPMHEPSAAIVAQVPSHWPVQAPVQVPLTRASQVPWQVPEHEAVQATEPSTVQLPLHVPVQPPETSPPVQVGGVAVASKVTSQSATQSTTALALTLQTPGVYSTTSVAMALADFTRLICATALSHAVSVSVEDGAPRSVAMPLQAVRTSVSMPFAATAKRALASRSASRSSLPKFATTGALKSSEHVPGSPLPPSPQLEITTAQHSTLAMSFFMARRMRDELRSVDIALDRGRSAPAHTRPMLRSSLRSRVALWLCTLLFILTESTVVAGQVAPTPVATRAAPTPSDEARMREVVRIVATGRLRGALATPACTDAIALAPSDAARVLGAAAGAHDEGAVVVDTGGLLGPSGIATFAAERAPAELAAAIAGSGFGAVAVGATDLSAPRGPVLRTWTALARLGVPVVATNLSCAPEARALCATVIDAADAPVVIAAGDARVAFIALVGPEVLATLARDKARGLRLEEPARALARLVPAARRAGATIVVVSLDDGTSSAAGALALAAKLPAAARPELLLSAGGGRELLFARPPSVTPALAAPPPGGAVDVHVRAAASDGALNLLARPLGLDAQPSRALARLLESLGPTYCERWGQALPGGRLTRPISAQQMIELTARVLRERAHADVAIVNVSAFDPDFVPLRANALTASDVYLAAMFDDPLVVATVDATWLEAASEALDPETLVAAGLTRVDDEARVANRTVGADVTYRVVTLTYLAEGAAGLLEAGPEWEPLPGTTLRSALLAHLATARSVDARDAVARPEDATEWSARLVVDSAFGGTSVANPSDAAGAHRYDAAQLALEETVGLGGSADVTVSMDSTWMRWTTVASLTYRTVWTGSADGAQPFQESDDLAVLQTTATWKTDGPRDPVWYMPRPSLGVYAEGELTVPTGPDATRDWRHLLLRPTLGASFLLAKPLVLMLVVGVEDELLSPDARFDPGAGAQLVLSPWTLGDADTRGITLDADVNYFVRDVFGLGARSHSLRAHLGATFALASWLGLGVGYDLYVEKADGAPVGVGLQAIASLRGTVATRTAVERAP